MSNTMQKNTDYICQWIGNDEFHYHAAWGFAVAGDIDGLQEYLVSALETAPEESTAWYVMRDMSASALDCVDWIEVANYLEF